MTVDGYGKQTLPREINQCADNIDGQQNAENLQNSERFLLQVLQIEPALPQQFF